MAIFTASLIPGVVQCVRSINWNPSNVIVVIQEAWTKKEGG
jgi:hypothetical protein